MFEGWGLGVLEILAQRNWNFDYFGAYVYNFFFFNEIVVVCETLAELEVYAKFSPYISENVKNVGMGFRNVKMWYGENKIMTPLVHVFIYFNFYGYFGCMFINGIGVLYQNCVSI